MKTPGWRRWGSSPFWVTLAGIGVAPGDSAELKVRKAVLTLSSSLMASLAVVWVSTYAALGLWASAAIPFAYQVVSVAGIYLFAKKRHYTLFRRSQLWLTLLLPFALQWSLGGFENSSAVSLWAFTAPLGALLFVGLRQAVPWFVGFVGLVSVSAAIDTVLAANAPSIPRGVIVTFFVTNILGVTTTAYVLLQYFVRENERERARSERLLLNVLPEPVATRLKNDPTTIADAFSDVTVLFADIVDFTGFTDRLPAEEVVSLLHRVFTRWDTLAARYGLEKIKTIGDAYMVAGGIPLPRVDHAEAVAHMALEMRSELAAVAEELGVQLDVRIGIDSGPIIAGVIGQAKFNYDLWGDTVNTASRMESHAQPGTIQVTERTYRRLRRRFTHHPRGTIEVKGKGLMTTYVLDGPAGGRTSTVVLPASDSGGRSGTQATR